jgi:hypothetical protein
VVNLDQLEAFFEYLSLHTAELLPDGIHDVSIKTLHTMHLLSEDPTGGNTPVAHLLQAIESEGKVTLFNDHFVLWIVPKNEASPPATTIYIVRRLTDSLKPELGFRTAGIHNRSRTILRLIERYLTDIQETDSLLSSLECAK